MSGWIGRQTVAAFGLDADFEELPNGVDSDLFTPDPQGPRAAEVLYVGSVREDKGVGLLLETFAELGRRRTNLALRVVGPLPGMSGLEAVQVLRSDERTRDIPVIALSAFAEQQDIERALQAGFRDYLTKPVGIHQFLNVLKKYQPDRFPGPHAREA